MITDEELIKIGASNSTETQFGREFSEEGFILSARAIYQLGRQHQRESDAALCRDGIGIDGGRSNGKVFTYPRLSEAIRVNTGDK